MEKTKKSVLAYLILTFALSSICYILWIRGGKADDGMSWVLMWCPAAGALAVRGIYYRKEKLLGWNPCRPVFLLAAVAAPAFYLGISYGIYWAAGGASLLGRVNPIAAAVSSKTQKSGPLVSAIVLAVLIAATVFTAAGEEIGWRGFLLPQTAKIWNEKTAVVVTGLVWAVWHMPIMIAGLYLPGTPLWYMLPMFVIQTVSATAVMAVLRFRSKSVWPAVLFHASHNFFDQVICQPLTGGAGSAYFVGETGILTVAALVLTAVWATRLRKKADTEN